ncbi:MAG: hypothetical protein CM1200mP2_12680 [Planctomycetaceae bacterium]|nr:MAG: hypothetical protein CM1200mP2_12680 [Planctomycetaceae bacterium]
MASSVNSPKRLPRIALPGQIPPTVAWVMGAIVLVVAWSQVDPGDARQRMDWYLQDIWMANRTPPDLHPDIVLILDDDEAAAQLGQTNARHRRARALRQLGRLQARTVIFDFVLADAGSDVSFYQDEALYDGLPTRELVRDVLRKIYAHDDFFDTETDPASQRERRRESRLSRLYNEDTLQHRAFEVLAGVGKESTGVVLPCYFRKNPGSDDRAVRRLVEELVENPYHVDTQSLASACSLPRRTVNDHFEHIVVEAAYRFVLDRDRKSALDVVAANAPLMADAVRKELDKTKPVLAEALSRSSFAIGSTRDDHVSKLHELELPRWRFSEHTMLAFAGVDADSDVVLRNLKTTRAVDLPGGTDDPSRTTTRGLVHQAVAAVQLHKHQPDPDASEVVPFQLRDDAMGFPLDQYHELIISWPLNARESWSRQLDNQKPGRAGTGGATSQVLRLSDLLQLAQHDREVHAARFEILLLSTRLFEALELESSFSGRDAAFEKEIMAAATGAITFEDLDRKFTAIEAELRTVLATREFEQKLATANEVSAAWHIRLNNLLDRELKAKTEARRGFEEHLSKQVAGKLCLVGDVRTGGLADVHNTPVGPLPGIIINASLVNTMLTGDFLQGQSLFQATMVTIALMLITAVLFSRLNVVPATASVVPLLMVIAWVHHGLLTWIDTITQPVMPLVGVVACFSAVTIRKWWLDNLARRRVRRAFEFYLHPAVVERVAEQPDQLQLGGAATELSILFSDIRGFTTIAERLPDGELTTLLNEYLTAMTEVVFENNGTVDKYIGDAIMAFYGAPIEDAAHPLQACRTAIQMSQRLQSLREQWQQRGLPAVRIGIGINTDTVRLATSARISASTTRSSATE